MGSAVWPGSSVCGLAICRQPHVPAGTHLPQGKIHPRHRQGHCVSPCSRAGAGLGEGVTKAREGRGWGQWRKDRGWGHSRSAPLRPRPVTGVTDGTRSHPDQMLGSTVTQWQAGVPQDTPRPPNSNASSSDQPSILRASVCLRTAQPSPSLGHAAMQGSGLGHT